ncbi:MAG: hypothetical protein KAI47_09415 [Deltaproteobacteria bacterium]|nr:hypothetical protein [Deltaproteobacteria bacterium]
MSHIERHEVRQRRDWRERLQRRTLKYHPDNMALTDHSTIVEFTAYRRSLLPDREVLRRQRRAPDEAAQRLSLGLGERPSVV